MDPWDVNGQAPRPSRHYPSDLNEFEVWFTTEKRARAYLEAVRFRGGAVCPRCGIPEPKRNGERWWCGACRRWFTVTTGTLLERTKIPLRIWLTVAWQVVSTKIGVSALSIQRVVGLNYQTAWAMLHKMRVAMDQEGRDRLRGDVEFDETYVGGHEEGRGGRSRDKKEAVAVACEHRSPTVMGRIRLARLPDASALALADFLEANVEPGSVLLSDSWASYEPALIELADRGLQYTHKPTTLSLSGVKAPAVHPHVHRVASLLKRWLLGTHQGAVAGPHLDAYLDEFVFRFNRRNSRSRGLVFWRLVCALLETPPLTRQELRLRAEAQALADAAHAARVKRRKRQVGRDRYQRKVEAAGRTVRPYRPRREPESDDYDPFGPEPQDVGPA